MLITNEQAIAHLREDAGTDVALYVGAATQAAIDFLNRQVYVDAEAMAAAVLAGVAGDDPMVVNDAIKAAILLTLGHLWANREDVLTGNGAAAVQLPLGARPLLWPHRVGLGA